MLRKNLLKKYFIYVNSGYNLDSKLRLAIIVAFSNHIILRKVPALIGRLLIKISNKLSRRVVTKTHGLTFKVLDWLSCFICTQSYENWAWEYLHIQKGDVFLDIGAHIGKYTLPVAKAVGEEGLVIAVEASIENYYCLKSNIENNGLNNVRVVNAAAWSSNERLKFFLGETSATGTTKKDVEKRTVDIIGRSMDSLLEELARGGTVDWIKIDVEGAELEVLKGLNKTLHRSAPKLLIEVLGENRNVSP